MLRTKPLAIAVLSLSLTAGAALAQAPAKVDPNKGAKVAQEVCAACHAADGNSTIPANPKLAGQHVDYLIKQLHDFRAKAGAKEADRPSAVMAAFAQQLSEEDIRNVSAHFALQKLKPTAARNKDLVELGQKIYRGGVPSKGVPACAGCHSPTGAGIPAQYPRLHGQFADYTESQLVAFRQGARRNSAPMAAIADRLSDREIKAVSDYIAGLR
ncbi:MAG: cytochrome c [Burkholderiaceae bacterium]